MCFTAAVWNATVVMQACGDRTLMKDILSRIEHLPEPARTVHSELLLASVERKLERYPSAGWVYRGVHVVVQGECLRVRAEALSLEDWVASGQPLRMGLVE